MGWIGGRASKKGREKEGKEGRKKKRRGEKKRGIREGGRRVVRGEYSPRQRHRAGAAQQDSDSLSKGGCRRHREPHKPAGRRANRLDSRSKPEAVAGDRRVRQPPQA